jgi:hypothetical protein
VNTSEELHRALADLADRADDDVRPDRLDRVHRRARRTARTRAAVASLAAVLVVGAGAALISRDDTAAPAGPGTSPPTTQAPTITTQVPISPPPSSHVPTTPATTTPAPTTSTRSLVPADSARPAAGACAGQPGAVVTIDANPDVPTPRCVVVRPDQRVRIVNTSDLQGTVGRTITVHWANFAPRVLAVGQATTFDRPAGDYLAVGVHRLRVPPLYGGAGAEVWLK